MIKRILALAAFLFVSAPALAQEINTDVGMDTPGAWMTDSGWTVTASKGQASGVSALGMLHQMSNSIKKGHRYRFTFDISNYTAGEVRAYAGITMPTTVPGSWITAASTTDIADNFTYLDAVKTTYTPKASLTGPGDSNEGVGAFRFGANHGKFGWIDPLVNPGTQSSHLHEFYCNTDVRENWTFTDFRTKGSSTCGNYGDPTHAINRSGYWSPGMFDGRGNANKMANGTVYYKGSPDPSLAYGADPYDAATSCADHSPTVDCRNIPTGLRMIAGYNSTTGLGGPTDTSSINYGRFGFDCWSTSQVQSPRYDSLEAARSSGHPSCVVGGTVRAFIDMPNCWDGVHVDSPNHRDHMSYSTTGALCPMSHPVAIPGIGIMAFYLIDQDFLDGKWRLSMDEMVSGTVAGRSLHFDYWEAWSPTARNAWYNNCIKPHNSCSLEFGDGNGLKTGGMAFDGTSYGQVGEARQRPDTKVPLRLYGMSKDFTANGTYTVELTAPGDGVFGFMGSNGFIGKIDNVHVVEITTAKGPVTVTGTGS